jgi:S1-C subfamily serine protease
MKRVLIETSIIGVGLLILSLTLGEMGKLKEADIKKEIQLAKLSKVMVLEPHLAAKRDVDFKTEIFLQVKTLKRQLELISNKLEEKPEDQKKYGFENKEKSKIANQFKNAGLITKENQRELNTLRAQIEEQRKSTGKLMAQMKKVAERKDDLLNNRMLLPTVQISGEENVGSGTIIYNKKKPGNKRKFITYILTANHVIRNIENESVHSRKKEFVVTIYDLMGVKKDFIAEIVLREKLLDVALLRINNHKWSGPVALLPKIEDLKKIKVWSKVFALGCPLGNDPIPTGGFICNQKSIIKNSEYWMINAPTYFGNSGGGVFDSNSMKLIAVFSKIYTHGKIRPVVISHMGLVVPLTEIYPWLKKNQYGFLIPN